MARSEWLPILKNKVRRTITHAARRIRGEKKTVASLTSYPPRIGTVHLAIQSLLAQRTLPDLIVLWLYTEDFPGGVSDLPEELRSQLAHDVQIRWVRRDLKPHKKYFWAFQEFKDSLVLTFDDDLIYRNTLISDLINAHKVHPDCVCATRTHLIRFDNDGKPLPYSEWEFEAPKMRSELINTPRMDLFATTGAGTLFPAHLIPTEAFDADAIERLCLNADDVWLKMMELYANIPVVAATSQQELTYIPDSQEVALWKTNIDEGANDRQLAAVLKHLNNFIGGDTLLARLANTNDE